MQSVSRSFLVVIFVTFAASVAAQTECPPFYMFTGEAPMDFFGSSVSSAGDVNNDGYNDIIIAGPGSDARDHNAGRIYVFSGLNGDTLYVFDGEATTDWFGSSASNAGDVNNDGHDDLIVGAPFNNSNGRDAGRAYVFSGLNGDTLFIFNGEAAGDELGTSVASAGDVNNDGYVDLIVGAPRLSSAVPAPARPGKAYVYSGINGQILFVFTGEALLDRFGNSVNSAGDVNNDGYDDLIVSAISNSAKDSLAGRVYVFSGFDGDTLYIFDGEASHDFFGTSIAPAGDVNNDGYDDLIIGATHNDRGGLNAGRVYVFSGQNGDTLHIFTGEAEGDRFGISVASVNDFNADGYSDLIVGAQFNNAGGSYAGRIYVFSGLDGDTLVVLTGKEEIEFFGASAASAGDVNADGFADIIIGAPANDAGGFDAGRAYVYLGFDLVCGDANNDGIVNVDDLTFLITFYFLSGESPAICNVAELNNDGKFDIGDIVYLSNYLNGIGPAPCSASEPPPHLFDPKGEPQRHQTVGY